MAKEYKQLLLDTKNKHTEITLPLRLQAYERMALFLERIELNNLINRINYQNFNILQFQQVLIEDIRSEYNHNLSQQVYLSTGLWINIIQAKEQTIGLVNHAAIEAQKEKQANITTYVRIMLTTNSKDEIIFETLKNLKEEVQGLF